MSIDEGVELEGSEGSCEMINQPQAATVATNKTNLVSFSSSEGSSDVASFDSATDPEMLFSTVQVTPWAFTSGESVSSAIGLELESPPNQEEKLVNSSTGTVVSGRYLAVPGPSNTLQVPGQGVQGGSQDGFFHSGRRASDGLATRTDILQLQQLMKTRGVAELQKELESLPIPTVPRRSEPRAQRLELRHDRPVHQYSFEEGARIPTGRLSPFSGRKSRTGVTARPRLAMLGRSRQPAIAVTKSPLAELNTLCRMLPTATLERNRSPLNSDQQMLQQQFQQLGIDSGMTLPLPLPSSAGINQIPIASGQTACLSDQRLATPAPPSTLSEVSTCCSQDNIHSYTTKVSVAPVHLPVGQPVAVVEEVAGGSVRRHMVRRTLYRLVHQQTLISSFGEEDIAEVSPVSEQTGSSDVRSDSSPPSNSMDVT